MQEEVQLPEALTKELSDKSFEKREIGAKNLEMNIINLMVTEKNEKKLRAVIRFIKTKFVQSTQIYHKLGGLQALSAIASSLSKDDILAEKFVVEITNGMLDCFIDKDEKVRFAGIEYLFYVCRSLNEIVLINFNDIFEQLMLRSVVDADDRVKKAVNQLTNNLKGIITRALPEKRYFNVVEFMPILCQNMTKAVNPVAQVVLINWISTLNSIPNIEMFDQLPRFLEHLFMMLGDQNRDVRDTALKQMNEFMLDIEPYSKRNFYKEDQAMMTHSNIIDILIKICNSKLNTLAQQAAISWIGQYLRIFLQQLDSEQVYNPSELSQSGFIQLRTQASTSITTHHESALRRTIMSKLSYILEPILAHLSHEDDDIRKNAQLTNELLQNIMDKVKNTSVEFMNILPTVQQMYNEKKSHTAQSALKWMHILFKTYSDQVLPTINDILSNLIERLHDADSSVIENLMDLLGSISLHEQYFELVFEKILNVFYQDDEILQKKSDVIIKKLCEILNPQQVYTTISIKLLQIYSRKDANFISKVSQTLEHILITEKGLRPTRELLRNLKYELENREENFKFFETIYSTFCFNQVSVLTLSLLAEEYELSYYLVLSFADVEQDVDTLVQVAKLIYMLESPIFAYVRLQLLEHQKYPYLLKTLKGLLMLLPQTSVQKKLKQRLSTIGISSAEDKYVFEKEVVTPIDTSKMLEIYRSTRQRVIKSQQESPHKDDT